MHDKRDIRGSRKPTRVDNILNFKNMKKLGKLNLKSEKMLSQNELVSFRGGSSGCGCPELNVPEIEYCFDRCRGDSNFEFCMCCCKMELCYGSGGCI